MLCLRKMIGGLLLSVGLVLLGVVQVVESFLGKLVYIFVFYVVGGVVDVFVWILVQVLVKIWGQQFVIDNCFGVGGIVVL